MEAEGNPAARPRATTCRTRFCGRKGITKVVPGTPGMEPVLNGNWWYQWGTNGVDPDVTPASCPPDPDNLDLCDDGVSGSFDANLVPGVPAADNPMGLARAYLQKDAEQRLAGRERRCEHGSAQCPLDRLG